MTSKTTPKTIPSTVEDRRTFLKTELQRFKGKAFICPALSYAKVFVNSSSISETISHAGRTKKSTLAALQLDEAIKTARYVSSDKPKEGNQTKKFKFLEVYVMKSKIEGIGTVKLTIGVRKSKDYIHYCITAIE